MLVADLFLAVVAVLPYFSCLHTIILHSKWLVDTLNLLVRINIISLGLCLVTPAIGMRMNLILMHCLLVIGREEHLLAILSVSEVRLYTGHGGL